ncbi:MAG TPA: aspartate carbamoyltransferase catalytic subunit [Candidatus Limnocylindria bacterium]|nr:aspartate carbamoyltransferase catalytic subunit [Candidatus Limnocylindria bacterium]
MTTAVPAATWAHRHLLDVDGLSRAEIETLLSLAVEMREARAGRVHRSLLEAETVALAFFEASTRTRISFELAAKALGATTVDLGVERSSVGKGESLVDTLRTLDRAGVTTVVMRHSESGAPHLAARETGMRVINAGDGIHAHPTQALLDALTLREFLGSLDGRRVVIVGDVAHSRVARSNIHSLQALGASVRVAGPAPWVAEFDEWRDVEVATTLEDGLRDADAVMALRVQLERGAEMGDYVANWRLDGERMALALPGAPILHPGPTNEGVELTAELANGPRSLIGRQVENGVPIRMAVLALVCGAV